MSAFDLAGKRLAVLGHNGMVGSALVRRLKSENCEILTASRSVADLRDQARVEDWFQCWRPHVVFLAAATVGGIAANSARPAEFIYDNLLIAANVINTATHLARVQKLLFLGSSCIYPREAPQPITEDALLTGPLEPTNEWYAVAKIAGVKLCQAYRRQYGCDFISAMPCNLYGPGDTYDPQSSHVIPALIAKAHRAWVEGDTPLTVWGSGEPRREFLHVDDLADALVLLMKGYSDERPINVGYGEDVTIAHLAWAVRCIVGFRGDIRFDASKPDGTPRKLLDSSRINAMGWRPKIGLEEGLADAYAWYLANVVRP